MSPIQIDLGGSPISAQEKKIEKKGPVLGIDLGTTNSLVAVVLPGEKKASLLYPRGESPLIPSVLEYSSEGKLLSVGDLAVKAKGKSPYVFSSIKRLMGRSYNELSSEKDLIPYALSDEGDKAQVKIKIDSPKGVKKFSPIEMSAEILKVLKLRAENLISEKVHQAVLTVPAYFDDAQRNASKAAGQLAGLEIIRILNEPTAAALAFGWSQEKTGRVAVYDLGGGTFDLSILRLQENIFEVLSTTGDTQLGGDDLDKVLASWVLKKAQLPSIEGEELAYLLKNSEAAKIKLSHEESTSIEFRKKIYNISRLEAEKLWAPYIHKTLECFSQALKDAHLKIEEIDDILLVGGSTRLPLVKKSLKLFSGRDPNNSLNPEEAVALGAALQAEILGGRGENRLLLDVVPLSLGIETLGGSTTKIIHRNSTIPTEAREIYTNHAENQNSFDIHVLQGERELVQDCRSLARFKLRGLDPAPAGYHRIEILFRIDANGILNVRAQDLRSGKSHEIEVRPTYGITDEEMTQMLESSYEHAQEDISARLLIDTRMEADRVIFAVDKALKNSGELIPSEELSEIKARLVDLKNATKSPSPEPIRKALSDLNEASLNLAELQMQSALKESLQGKDIEKIR